MQNNESKKLNDHLPDWNKQLHAVNAFGNDTFKRYLPYFDWLIGNKKESIKTLDFGCGSNGGIINYGYNAIPHDPYVDKFAAPPWNESFEAVFSADVMEHMPVSDNVNFLKKVAEKRVNYAFFAIATRAANLTLANGINAHITVEPGCWWFGLCQAILNENLVCVTALSDMLSDNVILGFMNRKEARIRGIDSANNFISGAAINAN